MAATLLKYLLAFSVSETRLEFVDLFNFSEVNIDTDNGECGLDDGDFLSNL